MTAFPKEGRIYPTSDTPVAASDEETAMLIEPVKVAGECLVLHINVLKA